MVSNFELVAYIGTVQSVLLACALLWLPEGNTKSNRLLAALLIVSGTYLLIAGIGNRPELRPCLLNETFSWIALSFGPLLWFYVRAIAHADFAIDARQYLHFLPILPCLLLIFYDQGGDFCNAVPGGLVGTVITILVIVSFTSYCLLSLGELKRHQQTVKQLVSSVEWNYVIWLRVFICAIFIYIAFGIVGAILWELEAVPLFGSGLRIAVFSYLLCYLVIAEALFHPEIFSERYVELLRLKEQHLGDGENQIGGAATGQLDVKYQRSRLSEDKLNDYWLMASQYLEEHQIYLQPDLRISLIANDIGISINHLSQAINVVGGSSFYDLINRYRIEHAKRLLRDPTQDYKSVVEIGMDSGFNSQSAFYKAFNRVEGTTPAKYRKSRR